jgi:large subunit ribosomal protein L23
MDLTHVIVGPVFTEKSERLKQNRTYTLQVAPDATKIDVKNALKKFYDVEVTSIRAMRIRAKVRDIGTRTISKRRPGKRMMVTLSPKSKPLDVSAFKVSN